MIDWTRYLAALRAWWWLPVVGVLAAGLLSYTVAGQLPRVYEARATLLVDFAAPQTAPTYNDTLLSQQLVKTYAQMIVQPIVLEQVGPRLQLDIGVDDLERFVSAQPVRDTQLITVTAQAQRPELARDVANAVADTFISQQTQRVSQSTTAGPITVVQPARLPGQPIQPRLMVDVALAVAVGVLLMLGLVYVLAWVDDTVKSLTDAEKVTGTQALAVIPHFSTRSPSSRSESIEAYRLLRTALDFASAGRPLRTIVITSPGPREGKSTVVANLALALAHAGTRVVALDANLRQPALHRQFGIANDRGLTNLLEDAVGAGPSPMEYCRELQPNLWSLTAGPSSGASTELLRSYRFTQVLEQLQSGFDVLVVDCPSALSVADALVIANLADATLLVLAAMTTRSAAASRASTALDRSGTRLLGVVLNRAPVDRDGYPPAVRLSGSAPSLAGPAAGQIRTRERYVARGDVAR
jgi:succinoglycan biosynthesis transport protein ExoP